MYPRQWPPLAHVLHLDRRRTYLWAGVRTLLMIQPEYHHALLPVPSVFCIKKERATLVYLLLLSYLSYGALRLEEVTPPLNTAFEVCSEI